MLRFIIGVLYKTWADINFCLYFTHDVFSRSHRIRFQESSSCSARAQYLPRWSLLEWNTTTLIDVTGVSSRFSRRKSTLCISTSPRWYNFCLPPAQTVLCRSKPERFNGACPPCFETGTYTTILKKKCRYGK